MTTYRKTERSQKTVRFEVDGPVDRKTMRVMTATVEQEFAKRNGRAASYDNDWWIEPNDAGVVFVFIVEGASASAAAEVEA